MTERQLGRVIGPCKAPHGWNLTTAAITNNRDCDTLTDPPAGEVGAAASFPILQTDGAGQLKVRRGEDWRRSGHNATVRADDIPTHHFVTDFAALAWSPGVVVTWTPASGHPRTGRMRSAPPGRRAHGQGAL